MALTPYNEQIIIEATTTYTRFAMLKQANQTDLLKRVDTLGREIERLRRDLLLVQVAGFHAEQEKPSLFGAVRAGDITPEMIAEAQQSLCGF
jgi:hypothetical protein